MADIHHPGARPFWTPETWLAGFVKGTTRHCYTQNIKALGFGVSERKIFLFPIVSLCGANDPQGRDIFDPTGMIGRIYVGYH